MMTWRRRFGSYHYRQRQQQLRPYPGSIREATSSSTAKGVTVYREHDLVVCNFWRSGRLLGWLPDDYNEIVQTFFKIRGCWVLNLRLNETPANWRQQQSNGTCKHTAISFRRQSKRKLKRIKRCSRRHKSPWSQCTKLIDPRSSSQWRGPTRI